MQGKVDKTLTSSLVYLYLCDVIIQFEYLPLKLHKERICGHKTLKLTTEIIYFKTTASLSLDLCKYRGKEGRDGRSILSWPEMPCGAEQAVL